MAKGLKKKSSNEIAEKLNKAGFIAGHKGDVGRGRQVDKIDRGVTARTVSGWMRDAKAGRAPFSASFHKTVAAYQERCDPEDLESELEALAKEVRLLNFRSRDRPDL